MSVNDEIISEIESLIEEGERLNKSFSLEGMGTYESDIPEHKHRAFVTSALASIERIAGKDSQYYERAPKPESEELLSVARSNTVIPGLQGVLTSLRDAVEAGFLESIESQLRASIHDDMLEQGADLLDSNYHVAAMVLIGGVLEDHLRQLCESRNMIWSGRGSISEYNNLLKDDLYKQTIWRRVQAVADVRNNAAHGNIEKVDKEDVSDSLNFVRRVIADFPE